MIISGQPHQNPSKSGKIRLHEYFLNGFADGVAPYPPDELVLRACSTLLLHVLSVHSCSTILFNSLVKRFCHMLFQEAKSIKARKPIKARTGPHCGNRSLPVVVMSPGGQRIIAPRAGRDNGGGTVVDGENGRSRATDAISGDYPGKRCGSSAYAPPGAGWPGRVGGRFGDTRVDPGESGASGDWKNGYGTPNTSSMSPPGLRYPSTTVSRPEGFSNV